MSEIDVLTHEGHGIPIDFRLWGKSEGLGSNVRYPVVCHLLDAAAAAEALWRDHVSPGVRETIAAGVGDSGCDIDQVGALIAYWAGLHDIGKLTYGFQSLDRNGLPGDYPDSLLRRRHDLVAAQWLRYALPNAGYTAAEGMPSPAAMVAQILGGHHGCFHGHDLNDTSSSPLRALGYVDDAWEEQRRAHLAVVTDLLGRPTPPEKVDGPAAALICGLIIQADWLVSQVRFVRRQLDTAPSSNADLKRHLETARQRVPGLLADAGLARPTPRTGTFAQAFPEIKNPNGLQRSLEQHLPGLCDGPGLLIVTAPMGEGKTEAGLHAADIMGRASGRNGLYVALPTMATADQMYTRINDHLNRRLGSPATMTLLHGMAWLNTAYLPDGAESSIDAEAAENADPDSSEFNRIIEVTEWLLGRKRGLFADYSIGTVDQALMAVLRSRHNVVRMLGLSGKTVIIDEVHAADAYMQELLARLLNWLGRLHVPVILLSATLHRKIGTGLINAYLKGAGRGRRQARGETPGIEYPGWVYADGRTYTVTANPEPLTTTKRDPLTVSLRQVPLAGDGAAGREQVLCEELADLVEHGGCAAVICTTVAESQDTFLRITEWAARRAAELGVHPPEVHLLHSRFPAAERERITARVVRRFGRKGAEAGDRPPSAILVATQIIEQSLDLDMDLLITDLAPVHLLLQRSGRCWRHEHLNIITRPEWAREPRMVVIAPPEPDAEELIPKPWRFVYHSSLLMRTHNLLLRWEGHKVRVPEDIQELVDGMYDDAELNTANPDNDIDRLAEEIAHRQLGQNAAVPAPGNVRSDLYRLTDRDIAEADIATRFGADSVRVICCYTDGRGGLWLDSELKEELPVHGDGDNGRFTSAQLRALMALTIPVPGMWLKDQDEQTLPPEGWATDIHLRDLRLIPQRVSGDGVVEAAEIGSRTFLLDKERGLVAERLL